MLRTPSSGVAPTLTALGLCCACSSAAPSLLPDLHGRDHPSRARAVRTGADGPFIQHEMAAARPGDVLLENAFVRFYVTAQPDGGDGSLPYAGWIIDAALAPEPGVPDYDGLDAFNPLVNLSPIAAEAVSIDADGSDGGPAVVSVSGKLVAIPEILGVQGAVPDPVEVDARLEYSLAPDARALAIRTRIENPGSAAREVGVDDVILFGDDEAEPFTLPGGFDQLQPLTAPLVIGSGHERRPISYAVYAPGHELTLLQGSTVADQLGGDGSLVGYRIAAALLEPGATLEVERRLAIARDVAGAIESGIDRGATPSARIEGEVVAAGERVGGARVSVFADPELRQLVTQAISDADGHFVIETAAGHHHVVASGRGIGEWVMAPAQPRELAEGYTRSSVAELSLAPGEDASLELALGPSGRLQLDVRDADGAPSAAKITLQPEDARSELCAACGEREPRPELGVRELVWTADGAAELALEPGTYTLTASRGPSAELDVRRGVRVRAGETTSLVLSIVTPIRHAGHVALDPHVHGVYSQHGEATRLERVITAVAEGLDAIVTSDHDAITDYGPALRELGLGEKLLAIGGVELKTSNGDHCAWPLAPDPAAPRGGARRWWLEGRDIAETYRYYRARGAQVLSLAHGASHFRNAGYERSTGSVEHPELFSFELDAMEVHNGGGNGGRGALVPAWMSLIDAGHRVAPLAASDSHSRRADVGVARTYVRLGALPPSPSAIAQATLELRTVASTGPFIELASASGAGPGDTERVAAGAALVLRVSVWAPSWMPLDAVSLLAGGTEIERWDASTEPPLALDAARGLWLDTEVTLAPSDADRWYAVEASGSIDLAPVYPGSRPWALTAPLFVDADGDGVFRAHQGATEPAP